MTVSLLASPEVESAQLQAIKNKMQLVLTHLVRSNINHKDGEYYEIQQNNSDSSIVYTISEKSPRTIAKLILPYVLWVVSQYINRVNGHEIPVFNFTKKADPIIKGVYHLNVSLTDKIMSEVSIILMYMVVVFQDHFESNRSKKVPINRLSYLLV